MKYLKLLAAGFISSCFLVACGASDIPPEPQPVVADTSESMLLPLFTGEAPISLLTSPQYPDAIVPIVILKDLTDEVEYNLDDCVDLAIGQDGFTVQSGHSYQLTLRMSSDGDPIKDIELAISAPETSTGGKLATIRLLASNRTTTQGLMLARIFLYADDAPVVEMSDTSKKLCDEGIYLGDINNTPVEVTFDFLVL